MTLSSSFKTELLNSISIIINENSNVSKKEFIKLIGNEFDKLKNSNKKEKKLNSYQLFIKEQMPILIERENNKNENEIKLKKNELLIEIAKLWNSSKEENKEIKEKPKKVKKGKKEEIEEVKEEEVNKK